MIFRWTPNIHSYAFVIFLLHSGCQKCTDAQYPLTDEEEKWLHQPNGAVWVFENNLGERDSFDLGQIVRTWPDNGTYKDKCKNPVWENAKQTIKSKSNGSVDKINALVADNNGIAYTTLKNTYYRWTPRDKTVTIDGVAYKNVAVMPPLFPSPDAPVVLYANAEKGLLRYTYLTNNDSITWQRKF